MALPIILAFMARMGLKYGGAKAIQMAIKKYGKNAVAKATDKMTYVGKKVAKKTKVKTYKDTKAHKATLKIRKKLGIKDKANPRLRMVNLRNYKPKSNKP